MGKKSENSVQEIIKSGNIPINKSNVISIRILNNTGLEVSVKEREAGNIRIGAGKEFYLSTFPECPFDFYANINFNPAAPDTDYIIFIINSLGNGIEAEEYNDREDKC